MTRVHNSRVKIVFVCILIMACLIAALVFWVCGPQLEAVTETTPSVSPTNHNGGFAGDVVLMQPFSVKTDTLDAIRLFLGTFGVQRENSFILEVFDGETRLVRLICDVGIISNPAMNTFSFPEPLKDVKDKTLLLQINTHDAPVDQAVVFYYGNSYQAARGEIPAEISSPLHINEQEVDGVLCMELVGRNLLKLKKMYWPVVVVGLAAFSLIYWAAYANYQRNGKGIFAIIINLGKYRFLLQQLISRDFKTRYKRSVLGVLWSILNPLLTMLVQYIVFSSLFKSSIPNFVVYLMCGGILFSFFSESVSLGLGSIVSNAPLITKVYLPKYIYPVSRVLSSAINLLMSMIPLFLLAAVSGLRPHKSLLLLPFVLLSVVMFAIGMSLIFSSSMVFFRDTQFLWGVLSTLWMYMTPIFYPDTIIPQRFLTLYHMNPMFQFIYFLREIVIDGVAPGPLTFLYCFLCSVIPLLLGLWIFKKTQDRFVLYL